MGRYPEDTAAGGLPLFLKGSDMDNPDVAMARQTLADLETVMKGAQRDIKARGGYAANPHASTLLSCLLGIAGSAGFGGADLAEMAEAIALVSRRGRARHEVRR
jgi:hypothetical protein